MSIRTEDTIRDSMIYYLENQVNRIDTASNTIIRDAFIDVQSREFEQQYSDLSDVQNAQGFNDPSSVDDDKIEDIAYNWNLTRKGSSFSRGYVTFISYNQPTDDIIIGNTDGSGGIIVSTRQRTDGTIITFKTLETVFLNSSTAIGTDGYYSVTASIICNTPGVIGNVSAGAITTLDTNVRGIDEITNTVATTGGKDQETNEELATRIQSKATGLHQGTTNGFRSVGLSIEGVRDAKAIGPNDSGVIRYVDGGGADLYILGQNPTSYSESIEYTSGTLSYSFTKKPVNIITKLSAIVNNNFIDLTENTDYVFNKDTTSTTAYSINSNDLVTFTGSGTKPDSGTRFVVSYLYDKNITDVQDLLDEEDSYFVTSDNLAKQSIEVLVNVGITITKYSGYVSSVVQNEAVTKVSEYFNNLLLGEKAEQSDLVDSLKDVDSIDNVIAPFTYMYRRGETISSNDLDADNLEYFRVDGNSISVDVL